MWYVEIDLVFVVYFSTFAFMPITRSQNFNSVQQQSLWRMTTYVSKVLIVSANRFAIAGVAVLHIIIAPLYANLTLKTSNNLISTSQRNC